MGLPELQNVILVSNGNKGKKQNKQNKQKVEATSTQHNNNKMSPMLCLEAAEMEGEGGG